MFKFKDKLPHLLMSSVVYAVFMQTMFVFVHSLNSGHPIVENDFEIFD